MGRKIFTNEFKVECASLVLDQGYSVPDAARVMDVGETAMRRWVKQLKQERAGTTPETPALTEDKKRIQELEAHIRRLEKEKQIPKKGYRSLNVGRQASFELISTLREHDCVCVLCRLFDVSRSSYYAYLNRRAHPDTERIKLRIRIKELFNKSRYSAGSRSLTNMLRSEGITIGRFKVRRLMREASLFSKQPKPRLYRVAKVEHPKIPNLLNRDFDAKRKNQTWCSDITYVRVGKRWIYVAAVLDLYTRRVVGLSLSENCDAQLAVNAVKNAYRTRKKPTGVLVHTDQGQQYGSDLFCLQLRCYQMKQSMSRRGNCWDNAPMERLFRSYKSEWMPKGGYQTFAEAQLDIEHYFMNYYNWSRPHQRNKGMAPAVAEKELISVSKNS
ncbi:IS3-like element ISDac1 family transposase [Desulfuromonas acetoxidans]|uniref:IS3-like element ISDac1 family transposase n=2 Tax=Desulfuromonas acetoxidans TaxID=891 RepID=UPI0012DBD1BF|nr:IS3-like element ISDac1 family transposase [Desulfuromonas acetoxidans]